MTRRMRAVIVDDMLPARERVARYLVREPDIEIAGEAENGEEAVRLITRVGPDIAFLDVGLPDFDGFEVVRRLPAGSVPIVIYLTAHGDKALEAFDVSAEDYLTKPFSRERFERALNRARQQFRLRNAAGIQAPSKFLKRLAVKEKGRVDVVDVEDIDYVDVGGHYLCIHVGKTVHLMRGRLSQLEAQLDPTQFARVHRSAIVRLDRVKSLSRRHNGDCDLILADGSKVVLSRTFHERLVDQLDLPNL
jgi:two-component system, LytTR family, response regulator